MEKEPTKRGTRATMPSKKHWERTTSNFARAVHVNRSIQGSNEVIDRMRLKNVPAATRKHNGQRFVIGLFQYLGNARTQSVYRGILHRTIEAQSVFHAFFPHLALAAFAAIRERLRELSAGARPSG
jgi:hypothetical protein